MSCWWILALLWLFFLPITYAIPLYWLEKDYCKKSLDEKDVEAIVILGAGLTHSTTLPKPNVNLSLLERLRFGAFLQRKTNVPILVTGGGKNNKVSEAEVMKRVLEEEFSATVSFIESKSNTTLENAKFTYPILKENGIKKIFLVSNSWHLKRATYLFEKEMNDIKIIPIADFAYAEKNLLWDRGDFIPSLATPYYQHRFYSELFRIVWLKYIWHNAGD